MKARLAFKTTAYFSSITCSQDCAKDIAHPTAECVEGGYQIQPGQCELCCSSNDCLDSVVNKIVATHSKLMSCSK